MTIVVPMSGRGSRVSNLGAGIPKPLMTVGAKTMVEWAFQSISGVPFSRCIFVLLREHEIRFHVSGMLRELGGPNTEIVLLDFVTEGQLCTVLAARDLIDPR